MATSFFYRKPDQTNAEGPCELKRLAALLHNKTICLETQVQDANRPDSAWRRIADCHQLREAIEKHRPHSDRPRRPPSVPSSSASAKAYAPDTSVSSAARDAPPASERVRQKPQRAAIAFAFVALLLAISNSAWLLFTTALAQPLEAATRAGLNDPAPLPATEQEGQATAPPPSNIPPSSLTAASEPPEEAGAVDGDGAILQAVLDRLHTIDRRLAHIEFVVRASPSGANVTKAIQTGEMILPLLGTELRFIYVPAGTFSFGFSLDDQTRVVRSTGNPNAYMNASPQVRVHMARGYFMLDREVTIAQWNAIMGSDQTASDQPTSEANDLDLPKRNVSWLEATAFCKAIGQSTSLLPSNECLVRLPTELEWEYAARGSGTLAGVTMEAAARHHVVVTKEFAQTPLAVSALETPWLSWRDHLNILGNLSEWCHDSYDQNLHESLANRDDSATIVEYNPATYSDPTVDSAPGIAPRNPSRVLRGGSFKNTLAECESPMRRFLPQDQRTEHVGFRPVLVVLPPENSNAEEAP